MHSNNPCLRPPIPALILLMVMACRIGLAGETAQPAMTNSFPTLPEVFQGRIFANEFERGAFFLRAIHDRYASHWPELLEANINLKEYIQSPDKLQRFLDELGTAMRDQNDPAAIASLTSVLSDKSFYTNVDAYHPAILRAAAQALISIGPAGRKALAASFTETPYRDDSESLEELAKVVGEARPADSELAKALAATAFDFSTANGGSYPRCTTGAVKNLLCLPEGASAVRGHLKNDTVLADPGRFQAVMDGIAAARTAELAPNLTMLATNVTAKLGTLTNTPGDYRNDLQDLSVRIQKTIGSFGSPKQKTE